MQRTITCSCGRAIAGQDEEELYALIREHVDRLHPERHRPVSGPAPQIAVTSRPMPAIRATWAPMRRPQVV
jgi:hypothetical protein